MKTKAKKLIKTGELRARYGGICERTVFYWLERGTLPQPIKINGYRYWNEAELDAYDARRETERA
jgi:predicted DNA-binding transcriptional regulator AlpA